MRKVSVFVIWSLTAAIFILGNPNKVFADNRWLPETFSTDLEYILRDDLRSYIYLADSGNHELVIIDSVSERVIRRIPVGGPISDMSISKDRRWLAVCTGNIILFNINSGNVREIIFPTGDAVSIAFDYQGRLYVSTDDYWGSIHHFDLQTGAVLNSFGLGPNLTTPVYQRALVKTDNTGTILYVGERGLSPASLTKIDVSGPDPVFLAEDEHGSIGSNLKDFVISPRLDEIYLACGAPYGIQVINSNTIGVITILNTDPYPVGVDIDLPGNIVCGLPSSPYNNNLYMYDVVTQQLIYTFGLLSHVLNGSSQDRGIAIERTGTKAFVIHGSTYYDEMAVQVVDLIVPNGSGM